MATNNYNDVIKIRNLIQALNMFALYDISVKELNSLIKSAKSVGDLANKIYAHGDDE